MCREELIVYNRDKLKCMKCDKVFNKIDFEKYCFLEY